MLMLRQQVVVCGGLLVTSQLFILDCHFFMELNVLLKCELFDSE